MNNVLDLGRMKELMEGSDRKLVRRGNGRLGRSLVEDLPRGAELKRGCIRGGGKKVVRQMKSNINKAIRYYLSLVYCQVFQIFHDLLESEMAPLLILQVSVKIRE